MAEKLREEGIKVEAHYSAYSGHLVLLASELTVKSGDLIVSVGGDGSFSEVLTGRMMLELGKKAEQQSLAKYGLDFVTDTYLPEKLAELGLA